MHDEQDESGTWHYGLIARYWAEFNRPEPGELAYYRAAIERFGQPALDLACGAGRLLVPLLRAGLDVDGVDISPDMLALCREQAESQGLSPRLERRAFHELEMPRRYGTIYICDSFGIGGRRDRDLETLKRIHDHLEPGGALVFSLELRTTRRTKLGGPVGCRGIALTSLAPGPAKMSGNARRTATNTSSSAGCLIWIRSSHGSEARCARVYSATEPSSPRSSAAWTRTSTSCRRVRLMLSVAGFDDVSVEGRYTGRPAEADDGTVVFVARASSPGLSASAPSA